MSWSPLPPLAAPHSDSVFCRHLLSRPPFRPAWLLGSDIGRLVWPAWFPYDPLGAACACICAARGPVYLVGPWLLPRRRGSPGGPAGVWLSSGSPRGDGCRVRMPVWWGGSMWAGARCDSDPLPSPSLTLVCLRCRAGAARPHRMTLCPLPPRRCRARSTSYPTRVHGACPRAAAVPCSPFLQNRFCTTGRARGVPSLLPSGCLPCALDIVVRSVAFVPGPPLAAAVSILGSPFLPLVALHSIVHHPHFLPLRLRLCMADR